VKVEKFQWKKINLSFNDNVRAIEEKKSLHRQLLAEINNINNINKLVKQWNIYMRSREEAEKEREVQ